MNIALLGFGTVGSHFYKLCEGRTDLHVAAVLSRRPRPELTCTVTADYDEIVRDPSIDIVVEVMGGIEPAYSYLCAAMRAGKHVVTANKQLMCAHFEELTSLAKEKGVALRCTAAAGGGIPWLTSLSRASELDEIKAVEGILNGTTNFILTQMLERGQSYESALRDAQARGYAEQDPTADVEGIDAGRKICILADMLFGRNVAPSRVSMTGISAITAVDAAFAEAAGMKLRLLGRAVRQGQALAVFVSPHFIAGTQPLAPISGVLNAVEVLGSSVGAVMFSGPGAGGPATASAVLGDVIDIVRNPGRSQPVSWSAEPATLLDPEELEASFFFRTRLPKETCEQALGSVRWLPDAGAFHGGFTEKTTQKALRASGLALDAVWPLLA